ncbi:hypothetical protein [Pseudoduganella sp. OTU4001]|uniref:hypothetical protein n=1 Tax=Pseudoduganella sp. OTU4001 TaxID=3043854 RepID=UPI00313E0F05
MKLTFQMLAALPPLAWLAEVDLAADSAVLRHGSWLECGPGFLMEGVWNGDFGSARPDQASCVFGSGVVLADGALVFVPSSNTTDYLYYQQRGQILHVANSLALLLAALDDELDPARDDYEAISDSIRHGIDLYQPAVPTRHGAVQRLIHRNLVLRAGALQLVDKPDCAPFASLEQYIAFMRARCGELLLNARDARRARPLRVLSTQSRGYDSTAVNSLAAPFGIDQAYTISDSKGHNAFADDDVDGSQNDDGSEIAAKLGFPCQAISRREFDSLGDEEYLYFAGICNSEDLSFAGVLRHVSQPSLLLTGTLGELYYPSTDHAQRYPGVPIGGELRRGDLGGGHGLTEVRLQRGVVQLPLIYCGARQRASIAALTDSPALDPWRLGTSYDRPIARFLAESAGVPRLYFGQKKMATAAALARPALPRGAALRSEFFDFLVANRLLQRWQLRCFPWVHRYNALLWFVSPKRHRWLYYLQRVGARLGLQPQRAVWRHLNAALHCFAVNRRAREYRAALAGTSSS